MGGKIWVAGFSAQFIPRPVPLETRSCENRLLCRHVVPRGKVSGKGLGERFSPSEKSSGGGSTGVEPAAGAGLATALVRFPFRIANEIIPVPVDRSRDNRSIPSFCTFFLSTPAESNLSRRRRSIRYPFWLAVAGVAAVLLGYVLVILLRDVIQFPLNANVYQVENLPVSINGMNFLLVGVAAMVISFLSTLYPSLKAARMKPAEGLRYE